MSYGKFKQMANAPGKVLLLGGYSILEGYKGLSIAIVDNQNKGVITEVKKSDKIHIISKQFNLDVNPNTDSTNEKNRIIFTAYQIAKRYLQLKDINEKHRIYQIKNSHIFGNPEEKSGLGSSAAATVSLISAIMEVHDIYDKEMVHKLSQISHALATGKIGSGFDIATSVYGTNIYQRFDKNIMKHINQYNFEKILYKKWSGLKITPFNFDYELLIFNVIGKKTSTIKSVSSAKKLMEEKPETYKELIKEQADVEERAINAIRNKQENLIRKYINEARVIQRKISEEVEKIDKNFTPIEPPEFTPFMDKVMDENLAIASRCPGGGGYDGIVFVVDKYKDKENKKYINQILDIAKRCKIKLKYIESKTKN